MYIRFKCIKMCDWKSTWKLNCVAISPPNVTPLKPLNETLKMGIASVSICITISKSLMKKKNWHTHKHYHLFYSLILFTGIYIKLCGDCALVRVRLCMWMAQWWFKSFLLDFTKRAIIHKRTEIKINEGGRERRKKKWNF